MWLSNRNNNVALLSVMLLVLLTQKVNASVSDVMETNQKTVQQLSSIVNRALTKNPAIQSAIANVVAIEARFKGLSLPLNNPELEIGTEHTDIETYTFGLSQTIDWHDKQNAQQQVVEAELAHAKAEASALRFSMSIEILKAVGDIASYHQITALSNERVKSFERFTGIAQQLNQAGDISSTELELARLSLVEAIMLHAANGSELIEANSQFYELSGFQLKGNVKFPETLPIKLPSDANEEFMLQDHPQIKVAQLTSLIARKKITFTEQDRKPDPTFGITAGREGKEDIIGASFSIPLQVRNNYSHQVDIAAAESLQADRDALQLYRSLQAKLKATRDRYQLIATAWSFWRSNGQQSLNNQLELLEVQWESGEMNTTDYLLQLQQTLNTQIAGVELKSQFWNAWIGWLSASGQLTKWLNLTTSEKL